MRDQTRLLRWYARHRRPLPWRETRDPYRILVSEVMAQQTQIDRVLPFYERWMRALPTAAAVARVGVERLHRLWQGLGYPSRADRLQATCRLIVEQRDGSWPEDPASLQELPGIGPYTAAAVACFAFGQPVALVDTNVARVYTRRDGLSVPVDKGALWRHAEDELHRGRPIDYNNALMELGALVCTARKPDCQRCPWRGGCRALAEGLPAESERATANPLKVASPKRRYGAAITDRSKPRIHLVLGLIHDGGRYLVARRPRGRPAGGYWELPGGKREAGEDDRQALARELAEELGVELLAARPFVDWHHDAGEHYLSFHCYRCRLFDPEAARALASDAIRWVAPAELLSLEFPPPNGPFLERFRHYHRLA